MSWSTPQAPSVKADRGLVVMRLGEVFLKGRNRRRFIDQLAHNARLKVADLPDVKIEVKHLRLICRFPRAYEASVIDRLARLFGVTTLSPAVPVAPTMEAFTEALMKIAGALPSGTTFKVDCNRRDKSFPNNSQDVAREVGGQIALRTGLPVDVHRPKALLRIEIAGSDSFVTGQVIPGAGGLPLGTAGKVGLLLSGGIDSPVAGWLAMRRGCDLLPIYFHSFPFTGDKSKEKVRDLVSAMAAWGAPRRLFVVHFTEAQKKLRDHAPAELLVVLYRRMMMRVASQIAAREGAQALVTGENLAQVASQTLSNLSTIDDASSLLVLRPLIAYDKTEIIARARAIGTFDISIRPYDDCCSLFVPKHPKTRTHPGELVASETAADVETLARALADDAVCEQID